MENYQLKRPASNKTRKRVGRGPGSGMGKTSTRGMNGQLCRSGSKKRPWFEGGQMPIQRRVPKRGFKNVNREVFQVVNISSIAKIEAGEIDPVVMKKKGLVNKSDIKIKILGVGEMTKVYTITADAFSKSAEDKIRKAGGTIVIRKKIEKKRDKAV